jgi:pimeloyl-ACP methyl ester carboxylesterase
VAHCIAPDLIGFGQSGKPDIEYRFADHVRYLDAFLSNAGISSAFVIAQDWGTALAFHLAARRPEFIRGLAFMEFLWPMPTWEDFPAIARETFQRFRTPGVGEKVILEGNGFVEGVLPLGTVRKLTDEEMSVYRAPLIVASLAHRSGRGFLRKRICAHGISWGAELVPQHRPKLGTLSACVWSAGDSPGAAHRWGPRSRFGLFWDGPNHRQPVEVCTAASENSPAARLRSLDPAGASPRGQPGYA